MFAGRFELDASAGTLQHIPPPDASARLEGVAFSPSGAVLGAAASGSAAILLYRRGNDGRFGGQPYCTVGGPGAGLEYPHALGFSQAGDGALLVVVQRGGKISIFQRDADGRGYGSEPVSDISGPSARLVHPDGVAFVPPGDRFIAACNLTAMKITFYGRQRPLSRARFVNEPVFELEHASLVHPDGLAFSQDGMWLATANHAHHSISVFRRRKRSWFSRGIAFGPEPVTIITDPGLRHPHSVAFSPRTGHLAVTNAGSNFFAVYPPLQGGAAGWSAEPVLRQAVTTAEEFRSVNDDNAMEGGAKGIAICGDRLAICSPEIGIRIYPIDERT